MDRVADMIFRHLRDGHSTEIEVEQLCPAMTIRASRIPGMSNSGLARNADRLMNRFVDYPRWLRRNGGKIDLFHLMDHSYGQLVLDLPPERTVVHCHDLDTFRSVLSPEQEPRPRWFRAMVQRTLDGFRRAAHVVCVSQATKDEILKYRLFPEERVSVICSGVDPAFARCSDAQCVTPREFGTPSILHVGSTIKRKRIDILLKSFASIVDDFPDARLVRVGGPLTAEQSDLANRLEINNRIVNLPFLNNTGLAKVYRAATILLQTSEAEGFGLPVIEAQACGCPVVASDIASLREAAGPAASFCRVGDIDAWRGTILRLLHEQHSSPDEWERRRQEGAHHASRFSWADTARQLVTVYRRVDSLSQVTY